jgi:hypothetical protein
MPRPAAARCRLALQSLEDRAVPAFTLTIDGNATTSFVSNVFDPGTTTTTFTASGAGAVLDVDEIETALAVGNVVITTGSIGSEAGNIHWDSNSVDDELDYFEPAVRSLTIRPSASSTVGGVTTDLVRFNFSDNVDLVIDTTAPTTDGAILLVNDTQINFARSLALNAGVGTVAMDSASADTTAASGDITITAGTFANTNGAFLLGANQGNITFNAPIDLSSAALAVRTELGTVTLNGPVGNGDLTLYGSAIAINAPVGETTPLNVLTFAGGTVAFGTNAIDAATILVGDGNFDPFDAAFGAGTATVTGNLVVQFDGDLAPGGTGTVGTFNLAGNLVFDGGDFALDLGGTSDRVVVAGDVEINFGRLGSETGTGLLTSAADVQVLDFTGNLNGEFFNAAVGTPIVAGADAIQVTNYGPAATGLTIAQVPAAPLGKATGVELDGTAYTVRLFGLGQLVVFTDVNNQVNVVTRKTTVASRIAVTTKVNACDNLVALGPVRVNGALAAFGAGKVVLTGEFTSTGPVKSLTFAEVVAPVTLGGLETDKTTFKAETLSAPVSTPGVFSKFTTTGDFAGSISAAGAGAIKVGGTLFGFGEQISVTNGITSITAARVDGMDLTAKFIGSFNVTGNVLRHVSGDLANSVVRLTGNDGTPGRKALKTLTVKGNVINSTIDVEEGSVGTVTAGRFIDSQLYLDYSPTGPFDNGGTFNSTGNFKLTKFVTTARTLDDENNPNNWSFSGSQVVADTLVTVRLSGLRTDCGGNSFGFKFHTDGGSVQTKTADATLPLVANLTPDAGAIAADFFYLEV